MSEAVNVFAAEIAKARRLDERMAERELEVIFAQFRQTVASMNRRAANRGRNALTMTQQEVDGLEQAVRDRRHEEVGIAATDFLQKAWDAGASACAIVGPAHSPDVEYCYPGDPGLSEDQLLNLSSRNNGLSVWLFAAPIQLD